MAAKKKGNQKKAKNKANKVKAGAKQGNGEENGGEKAAPSKQRNAKAFSFQSANKAKAARARSAEKEQRRLHGVFVCLCVTVLHVYICAVNSDRHPAQTTLAWRLSAAFHAARREQGGIPWPPACSLAPLLHVCTHTSL